ncbi:odorant receptor 4-like [Anthonomus grandis grandis]|uniref:odorant receptor 4-like n=1 Tax=Anthonomus grandis grandis TaxID=2921223 RepID=UPI0021662724|nr:odorant receptor 4-like [Anthonomus grandis grandis]
MMQNNKTFFKFNISVLKFCFLWENDPDYQYNWTRVIKDLIMISSLMPCAIPILADFIIQLCDGVPNLTAAVENMIALNCIVGMIYMVICFINNRRTIIKLMKSIDYFDKYGNSSTTIRTEENANLFSKVFMFYGIVGNFVYMLMPQLSVNKCYRSRTSQMIEDGVPCGLVVRSAFPFRFDLTPVFEIVFIHQIYTCTMVTVVVVVLTMLLCGFLMHIVNQIENLRLFVDQLHHHTPQGEKFTEKLLFVIRYHIDVIEYSQSTADAFSTMLLFYITLTSLVLSVLCFEIIMVDAIEDSVRFTLHLFGWIVILFSVCYNGQLVIDQSLAVAQDIYSLDWFDCPLDTQKRIKTIMMRSQKPLVMDAAGMGVISLPAFLKVLSSAYSFFTLLLKFKQ